jgi:predicted transcriptional regulator
MRKKQDKSLFLEYFGDTPQLRIFDFFISNYFFDYPLTEIARESNISYNSLKTLLPVLIKANILIKTRKVGKSDYYKLNMENEFITNLIKLNWKIVKADLGITEESLVLSCKK